MKRVKLTDQITEGPLLKSNSSVSKYGDIAIDSTFSEFGEYERQFYTTLQIGWFDEIKFYKPIDAGANVSISFRLNSDGTIKDIKVLESNATFIATTICENAIQKRSPFRPWTKRMIDEFGHERELKIRFYYR